ncbi:MAG: EF-hand domain-containing protein [Burkholderiaceae bacterium]|nr:EF-hand domain-containing protein [Burkholderiaceae bacterium]
MINRQMISSIVAVAAFAFISVTNAQTPTANQLNEIKEAQERFTAADKNGDGKLTLEEAKAGMPRIAANFKRIDVNNDGFVTMEEIKAIILR